MTRNQIRSIIRDIIEDVVVVGGVRRSAMISLSNFSDDRMRIEPKAWDDSGLHIPESEIDKATDHIMKLWDKGFVYDLKS